MGGGGGGIGVYKSVDPSKFEAKSAIRAKILDKSASCCINKIRNPRKTFARSEIRTKKYEQIDARDVIETEGASYKTLNRRQNPMRTPKLNKLMGRNAKNRFIISYFYIKMLVGGSIFTMKFD